MRNTFPSWQIDHSAAIAEFGKRHPNPEGVALLFWAIPSVQALHYLADLDAGYEASRSVPGDHLPDVVDVAHVQWATGTCITALDLCAASLARALGGHLGPKELDLGDFCRAKRSKSTTSVFDAMPPPAFGWLKTVVEDPAYAEIKIARDALTHRRLPRRLYASVGSTTPDPRLDLQVGARQIPARRLIEDARDIATRHLGDLLALLPVL